MTVLIVGGTGLLGRELVRQAVAAGRPVAATWHQRPPDPAAAAPGVPVHRIDLRDAELVASVITAVAPQVVINAAYRQDDWTITADGAVRLARAAASAGARFVQVSTDAVFSGRAVHCAEDAVPDPITPYGAAKAAAETAIRFGCPDAVIVRTSLIIGDHGESPQERRVRALVTGDQDGVLFTDDIRCPVHVADLAAALFELADSTDAGIRHVAGPDAMSRYRLGRLIALRDGLDPDALPVGRRAELGPPGPLDVRLDCARTAARLRTRIRGAAEFLRPS